LAPPPAKTVVRSAIARRTCVLPRQRNRHKPSRIRHARHHHRILPPRRQPNARLRPRGIWDRVGLEWAGAARHRHPHRKVHPERPRDARAHDRYSRPHLTPIQMQEVRALRIPISLPGKSDSCGNVQHKQEVEQIVCAAPAIAALTVSIDRHVAFRDKCDKTRSDRPCTVTPVVDG